MAPRPAASATAGDTARDGPAGVAGSDSGSGMLVGACVCAGAASGSGAALASASTAPVGGAASASAAGSSAVVSASGGGEGRWPIELRVRPSLLRGSGGGTAPGFAASGMVVSPLAGGRGGGILRNAGGAWASEGCVGGAGGRWDDVVATVVAVEVARGAGAAGMDIRFALSFSSPLQLAARSPMALAIPHRPLFRGGIGGFSPLLLRSMDIIGGGGSGGSSSSHTLSTMPVRTNAQRVQVVRRRCRHQPDMHRG